MMGEGKNFVMGVTMIAKPAGNYEVFCNWCSDSIGTMTFGIIRSAIWSTMARGGIRCPRCRCHTCDVCGSVGPKKLAPGELSVFEGSVKVCEDCKAKTISLEDELLKRDVKVGELFDDWA